MTNILKKEVDHEKEMQRKLKEKIDSKMKEITSQLISKFKELKSVAEENEAERKAKLEAEIKNSLDQVKKTISENYGNRKLLAEKQRIQSGIASYVTKGLATHQAQHSLDSEIQKMVSDKQQEIDEKKLNKEKLEQEEQKIWEGLSTLFENELVQDGGEYGEEDGDVHHQLSVELENLVY